MSNFYIFILFSLNKNIIKSYNHKHVVDFLRYNASYKLRILLLYTSDLNLRKPVLEIPNVNSEINKKMPQLSDVFKILCC